MTDELTVDADADADGLLSRRYRSVSVAIYTTVALVAFEGTAVSAALPEMAADLGRIDLLPWVVTAFLFSSGVATIAAGPLVDALGTRTMFVWSALVFAGMGFVAGLSNGIEMLIALRVVQGAASGVLLSSTLAAVNLAYPGRLTGRAFAANSTVWGLMGAAAPAVAAAMLTVATWRWIFFINLPLGALALIAGRRTLPDRQPGAETPSVDWIGVALAAAFTFAAILATDELGPRSLVYGAVSLLAIGGFALHARRAERPVLRLEHIAAQPYRSLAAVPAIMVMGAFAVNLYVALYMSAGRGYSTTAAAWSVLAFTVGWTAGANVSSQLLDRRSETTVMTGGLASFVVGAALVVVAAWTDGALFILFAGLFGIGVGVGLTTNAALTLMRRLTTPALIGRVGAAHQFVRGQGFTLGSAAGGSILLFVVARRIGSVAPVQDLLAGETIDADPAIAAAVRDGFATASVVAFVAVLVALVPMLQLRRWMASEGRRRA